MEKNVLWATVLSALFLFGWYHFFTPKPFLQKEISQEYKEISIPRDSKEAPSIKVYPTELNARTPVLSESKIETSHSQILIDSRGAALREWQLKEQKGEEGTGSFDLVNHPQGGKLLSVEDWPLSTYPELSFKEVKKGTGESVWRAVLPTGVEVEKRYVLEGSDEEPSHFLNLSLSFRNLKSEPVPVPGFNLGWHQGLGTIKSEIKENERVTRLLAYPSPTKEVLKFKTGEDKAGYQWVGVDNRYYLFAMFPKEGEFSKIETKKSKIDPGSLSLVVDKFTLSSGEKKIFSVKLYGGPKGYTHLKSLGLSLEHAVDFGYFGFLGKWALKVLETLHKWMGNYGWAIITLTCFLQILMLPLTLKSYQSTGAMKKLQPKIQEIQKRYKDDSKRLNEELLQLYKTGKTNPFGGCIPMILQIPVFWAFFTMLRNAYELQGAPWIFWIKDLSQHDPIYALPIIMGGGMFLQQKLSGTTVGDPTQAKVMAFMPLIFTFMFLKFPSGLVLYWLTNSTLSILTQYLYNKKQAASA